MPNNRKNDFIINPNMLINKTKSITMAKNFDFNISLLCITLVIKDNARAIVRYEDKIIAQSLY